MQNAVIAQVFDDIADCLEIAGENAFKIRAFRKAAEAIVNWPEPIEDVSERGELRSIPGLGETTAGLAQEYLATGTSRMLEELREQYPAGLLELLSVPNLGSKKIALLHKERGITSIQALTAAIESGQLEGLAGFGAKTIENIRQGLGRVAEMSKHLPIFEAAPLAREIAAAAGAITGVERIEIAGAVRRGCESIAGIELVAQTTHPNLVLDGFSSQSRVLSVIDRGDNWASALARPGIEVKLRCAPRDGFGALLLDATGSTAHLDGARVAAARLGLDLRADGFYRDGQCLAGLDEAAIYAALGVGYIEPELREGHGEWQAAETGTLPTLVASGDLRGDLHTHSTWSDGVLSIRQMAEAARACGYAYFAVTDHSRALAMANGLTAERLREQALEIAEVQPDFPDLRILRGVECDIMRDGSLDLDDDILHDLDIVVASIHSAFNLDEATQTARMIRACAHPAVDLMAHPTGRILGGRPGYQVDVPALIAAAREHGTALEINASFRLDLNDANARLAREAGVPLAIDSDAHSGRMLPNVEWGITIARRAWCGPGDILNAKSTEELLAWLKRPRARRGG